MLLICRGIRSFIYLSTCFRSTEKFDVHLSEHMLSICRGIRCSSIWAHAFDLPRNSIVHLSEHMLSICREIRCSSIWAHAFDLPRISWGGRKGGRQILETDRAAAGACSSDPTGERARRPAGREEGRKSSRILIPSLKYRTSRSTTQAATHYTYDLFRPYRSSGRPRTIYMHALCMIRWGRNILCYSQPARLLHYILDRSIGKTIDAGYLYFRSRPTSESLASQLALLHIWFFVLCLCILRDDDDH